MSSDTPKPPVPSWVGVPLIGIGLIALIVLKPDLGAKDRERKSAGDLALITAMSPLPEVPASPDNPFASDPKAAALGQAIFFDQGLSSTGTVSCATCHRPERAFTDGLKVAVGVGLDDRNTPSLIGAQFNRWWFWDGRRDSQWSQALGPLETSNEHNFTRVAVMRRIAAVHAERYQDTFGSLPDLTLFEQIDDSATPRGDESARAEWAKIPAKQQKQVTQVLVHVGFALEAYQRLLLPTKAPIDEYVAKRKAGDLTGGRLLSPNAVRGLNLFVGKAKCVLCHSGPLMTDDSFHNLALPSTLGFRACKGEACGPESGRAFGAREVLKSEFRCGGPNSQQKECRKLRHLNPDYEDFIGAFKTPSLREVSKTAPYMHSGEFNTLEEVLNFYNTMPGTVQLGHRELFLKPLHLKPAELADLKSFLETLSGGELPAQLTQALDPK